MVKNRRQSVIEFQEKHKLKSECKPRKKNISKKVSNVQCWIQMDIFGEALFELR